MIEEIKMDPWLFLIDLAGKTKYMVKQ